MSNNVAKINQNKNHQSELTEYLKSSKPLNISHIYMDVRKSKINTENHKKIINAIEDNKNTISNGMAGSGKTFIALNLGIQKALEGVFDKVVVFRSTVSVRDNGFLPGSEKDKNAPFELPYQELLCETFNSQSLELYFKLVNDKMFKFESTAFNQGRTISNSFIIVDETQNLTYGEIYNLYTRIGKNSVIHFCGDYKKQTFLRKEKSGFEKFIKVINSCEKLKKRFEYVEMGFDDIVRNEQVKDFIIADYLYEKNNKKENS
tara:strand:- start:45660 stop:46442 length:783 start_codon:yes stop_codon:yes gene_type:complete